MMKMARSVASGGDNFSGSRREGTPTSKTTPRATKE
jgi:hypothetical protein